MPGRPRRQIGTGTPFDVEWRVILNTTIMREAIESVGATMATPIPK